MSDASAPVSGDVIEPQPTVVAPTAAQQKATSKERVGNTTVQVTIPTALMTVLTWFAQLHHVDLDPGPGTDMPMIVTGAFIVLLTWAMARWMNREGYRAVDE